MLFKKKIVDNELENLIPQIVVGKKPAHSESYYKTILFIRLTTVKIKYSKLNRLCLARVNLQLFQTLQLRLQKVVKR